MGAEFDQAHPDIPGEFQADRLRPGRPSHDVSETGRAEAGSGWRPEPLPAGCPARGRRLLAGEFTLPGEVLMIPDGDLWKLDITETASKGELFGFGWLDDLAAVRSGAAIHLARKWVFSWIARKGMDPEAAWQAGIAGRRVVRLRHNERLLLVLAGASRREAYFSSLARHAAFLRRHARDAPEGLARIEALAGLVYAELADAAGRRAAADALRALAASADQWIDPEAGIPSRCPEDLHRIAESLQWCAALASRAGITAQDNVPSALRKAVGILRPLRHAGGSLARFHGGGSPPPGRLDRVLSAAGPQRAPGPGTAMGYARMSAAGTTVIADAAPPQSGKLSHCAHASTLAIEISVGTSPLVVSRGPGKLFGKAIRQASRQTASHSTVEVDGVSSSRMSAPVFQKADLDEIIVVYPDNAGPEQLPGPDGNTMIISHDGYAPLFGLTHMRRLDLSRDGSRLWAEDTLWARSGEDRRVFDGVTAARQGGGLPLAARFHLHPDVRILPCTGGRRVGLELAGGEHWSFSYEGGAELKIEPSLYCDEISGRMRESGQIVLFSALAGSPSGQLRWAFQRTGGPQR